MDIIKREKLAAKIAELRTEDEVDYQMVIRALTIIALLRETWQSWYDCMAFDVMIDHLLHRINQPELKARVRAIYLKEVQLIADEVSKSGTDGYALMHDLLWEGVCKN